ncbi:MAG: hypothetical protein H0S85_00315 [Desulfovibrionaceae bacterium]|jgi:hypothetical protein|nr:hypothetical protein [Desulfovibrionaceae bacterium]
MREDQVGQGGSSRGGRGAAVGRFEAALTQRCGGVWQICHTTSPFAGNGRREKLLRFLLFVTLFTFIITQAQPAGKKSIKIATKMKNTNINYFS